MTEYEAIKCSDCGIEGINACLGKPVKQKEITGNWRSHILVRCSACKKLMGYHKESNTALCTCCSKN